METTVAICAIVGAVLGIYNAVMLFQKQSVRLLVRGRFSAHSERGTVNSNHAARETNGLGVYISNLSDFDVSIEEIAVVNCNNKNWKTVIIFDDERPTLPFRIKSKESATFYFHLDNESLKEGKCIRVKVATGEYFADKGFIDRVRREFHVRGV